MYILTLKDKRKNYMGFKKSTIIRNWPKHILQWGVLTAIIVFMTGLIPSKEAADPEAYCPLGGLQALATYAANGTLPCSMSSLQVMMGIVLVAGIVLFSKLFCAYICPLGTVQDFLIWLRKKLRIKAINIRNGSVADKIFRIVKYGIVFWIFYMTVNASELFCKNFDPYYAIATGFKGEITLWMAIVSVCLLFLGSFVIDRFWCRYICPLGAISNSLKFWVWIGVLFGAYFVADVVGADIPWAVLLGAFCILGYMLEILHAKPKMQLLYVMKNEEACNHCGACVKKCPYHIDVKSCVNGKVNSVDCTLCGECVASCAAGALNIGVRKGSKGRFWKFVPALLTIVLIAFGMWAGGRFELPTIDMKWGIEKVNEDGSVTQLKDPETLQTMTMEGLRTVKCYGSSMTFKAKLEGVSGVHGVRTFVKRHSVEILYDPAVTDPDTIREAVYTPSKFRVATPELTVADSLKIVTVRTEGMYDRMDNNYLGMQIRATGKRIYGLETEFACPLIVRAYIHPDEELDKDWWEEIIEKDVLVMPGNGKEIELNYSFEGLEKEVSYISTEDFIRKMFSPFKAEFKSRVEKHQDDRQYVYEITDKNYEKPIILRSMPFLSNHLSRHDGIIGVYLNLNKDLMPAIQVRYAAPMTAEKVWELMTMETWTITYSKDDVRETGARLSFKKPGTVYNY